MAKIRRAGFGTVFNIENEKVGIGTTGKFFTEVRVLKNLELSDANAVTQAKLENYQGFLSNETRLSGNDVDLNKLVGYVRGEAYYGESHAHTQDDGTVVNMVGSAHTTFSHNVIDDSSNIQSGAMGDIIIDGNFTVSSGTTYCSSVDQLTSVAGFAVPTGNTDDRIHCHTAGSMRFNEDFGTLEFYTGDEWKTVNSFKDTGNRNRAIFTSGPLSPGSDFSKVIDKVNISSIGNATFFGNQTTATQTSMTLGNITRGIFQQGGNSSNTLEYVTIPSDGDSIDYGDLSATRYAGSGANSSTRGLFMGGAPGPSNVIDYVQIQTIGNALDFGDLFTGAYLSSGANSPTRAFKVAGYVSANSTAIQVVTMSSKGNATDFGDTDRPNSTQGGFSNSIRGIYGGGNLRPGSSSQIYMFNLSSQGSAIFFGNLAAERYEMKGACNQTRGLFAGGYGNPTSLNTIEFITIASSGNAQDFGDLTRGSRNFGATSDSHGGLGGF